MKYAKYLKILFLFAGMILSAKPILGFGIVQHAKADSGLNIELLQKLFSKRKQDYLDEDLTEVLAIQRGLTDPELTFIWKICRFFIGLVIPLLIFSKATQRYLRDMSLQLIPERAIYLSIGKLTI
ncbi:hypothetical protein HDF26_000422 [Pedobacter cryoconitis]|uniref:Uncharacterized protein n=1 Tax=Pedobacter cryoconitis TaxID=188932 RepID=A0A7W9DZP4_9SPHI|nr:hypothetical protein [Pedobacter cryoconitis]MBB5637567.1 hypothetical protein [Pedobacter cryoconitis]MBB6269995.1 hypothetical protein [Pedobacter cryoconitis]